MIAGFIINKFRGDPSLFDDGYAMIADRTSWRGFGVLPYFDRARELPAEDALGLSDARKAGRHKIAFLALSRIANFDDLDPLKLEPDVDLVMVATRRGDPRRCDARHPSRLEIDPRRSCFPARARLGHRHIGASSPRRARARPLRRLSDAGTQRRRSRRHRGAGRRDARTRAARRHDRHDGAKEPYARRSRSCRDQAGLRCLRNPYRPHRGRRHRASLCLRRRRGGRRGFPGWTRVRKLSPRPVRIGRVPRRLPRAAGNSQHRASAIAARSKARSTRSPITSRRISMSRVCSRSRVDLSLF